MLMTLFEHWWTSLRRMSSPGKLSTSVLGCISVSNVTVTVTAILIVEGSYDVIGKVTFGTPTGYLKAGKDFNNLIKRQQQFFEYANVVRKSFNTMPKFELNADMSNRFPKCLFLTTSSPRTPFSSSYHTEPLTSFALRKSTWNSECPSTTSQIQADLISCHISLQHGRHIQLL
jgi:hypothetical protein